MIPAGAGDVYVLLRMREMFSAACSRRSPDDPLLVSCMSFSAVEEELVCLTPAGSDSDHEEGLKDRKNTLPFKADSKDIHNGTKYFFFK